MQLASPSLRYKESYLDALREFQEEGRDLDINAGDLEKNFKQFIRDLAEEAEGNNLKEGRVPQTTYWAIDSKEYVGRISVRHHLNDKLQAVGGHIGYEVRPSKRRRGYGLKMLKQVLPRAKKLGITKALVTCDSTNIASRKIIERCGGVFEDERETEAGKPTKLRFWIDLTN